MSVKSLIGKGRDAIALMTDSGSFEENRIGTWHCEAGYAPGAVIGTGRLSGKEITVISNDASVRNPRFPVCYSGVIGLEEGYKMAEAVYRTIEADRDRGLTGKRPVLLLVDTPGNGPGKVEEITGMNKSTGAYQLALAEASQKGHPVLAVVIGRAISGAFLCHGLQADHIIALSKDYGTMIHVMPLTSIARITKLDIEMLQELSKDNPVFASGADFFHQLGGIEEIVENTDGLKEAVERHFKEIVERKASGEAHLLGPEGRGLLGEERGGRTVRGRIMALMEEEYRQFEEVLLAELDAVPSEKKTGTGG